MCSPAPVLPPRRHLSGLPVGYGRRRSEETGRESLALGGLDPQARDAPGLFHPQYRPGAQPGPFGGNRGLPPMGSPHGDPRTDGAQVLVGISRRHGTRTSSLGSPPPHDSAVGRFGTCRGHPPLPRLPQRGGDPACGLHFSMAALISGRAYPVAHALGHFMRALEAARGIFVGRHSPLWSDAFALSVGSPDDDDPHPGPGVRTIPRPFRRMGT